MYKGFRNIEKKKVFFKIIEEIERAIESGKLNPGDQLPPENEMVNLFSVSRASVREALRAMEYAGFVETRGGKGSFIREHSEDNLLSKTVLKTMSKASFNELIEARRFCEVYCLQLACDRITNLEKLEIERFLNNMEKRLKAGRTYSQEENIQFHIKIVRSGKNNILADFIEKILETMKTQKLFHYNIFLPKEAILQYHMEHELIFQAVSNHREEEITKLIDLHLDHIIRSVSSKQS